MGFPLWTRSCCNQLQPAGCAIAGSATFSEANQRDIARRSKGVTGISLLEPDTTGRVGLTSEPGKWFLRSELNLGRAAMLSES
jgi:hypothetical protein